MNGRLRRAVSAILTLAAGGAACVEPPEEPDGPSIVVRPNALATCAPRIPIASPPESAGHALTYDTARHVALLLGGTGGPGTGNATLYEFDVARRTWSRVDATTSVPTSRFLPVFTYDANTAKTVLFGGRRSTGTSLPRSVWEWDGCGWTDRTPATLPADWPSGRWGAATTFDSASGRVIFTTGIETDAKPWEAAVTDATVYEWDSAGGTFVAREPLGNPPASRGGAVAVSDGTRNLVYLTGGFRATDNHNDPGDQAIYTWNGATHLWSTQTPTPAPDPRAFAAAVFDPVADRMFLWGGIWYAWAWRPDAWRYAPGTGTFSSVATGHLYNRFWSPAAFDSAFQLAIQYGGAAAAPEDGFAGIAQRAFSDAPDLFISKQMGDTRQITSAGAVSRSLADPGATFSAFRTSPVTLDGVISAGEWDDAAVQAFTACNGKSPGLAYVKNDATNLYIALVLDGVEFDPTATRRVTIQFDNDGDGTIATGDNQWLIVPTPGPGAVFDGFNPTGAVGASAADISTPASGGTIDVAGAVTHSANIDPSVGTYVIELRGALDSADDAFDFSLGVGDTVGFIVTPHLGYGFTMEPGICTGGWPDTPALIRIAAAGAAPGTVCTADSDCARGSCVDGVCCTSGCGGGAADCQACSVAAGGLLDGTCTLLAEASVCRGPAGACDLAETCSGISAACPADQLAPADMVCRASAGGCDAAEVCSGRSTACPSDVALPPANCGPVAAGDDVVGFLGWFDDVNVGLNPVGSVALIFDGIGAEGTATVVESTIADTSLPPGFEIVGPHAWNIETTATFASLTVCVRYSDDWFAPGQELLLQILHLNHATATYENVTMFGYPDPSTNVICGQVTSLSPFVLALPPHAVDTVAPVFPAVPDLTAYATDANGTAVSYPVPTANDAVDGPVAVTCTPASGSTFAVGKTTVTCSAADAAGNTATAAFVVWVKYQAPMDGTFFLPPINSDGSSRFNRGSAVPLKFKLTGASAGIKNLVARLSVAKVVNGGVGAYQPAESTPACDGNTFRYHAGARQYIFNLSTKNMTTGTWSLRADLGDGVDHIINVSLR